MSNNCEVWEDSFEYINELGTSPEWICIKVVYKYDTDKTLFIFKNVNSNEKVNCIQDYKQKKCLVIKELVNSRLCK